MVRKVKIKIDSEGKKLHLPSIPISMLSFVIKSGKWGSRFFPSLEEEDRKYVVQGLAFASQLLKEAKPLLKEMDPFVLVEVETEDTMVLIELR